MKIFCFILGCLFYYAQGEGFLEGAGNFLGNISIKQIPGVETLENITSLFKQIPEGETLKNITSLFKQIPEGETLKNITSLIKQKIGELEKVFLQDWLDFGTKFKKQYNNLTEELSRKATFLLNIDTITKLATDSVLSFGLKINEFSDMLFDEFNELFNGFNRNGQLQRHLESSKAESFAPSGNSLPESIDWREKGVVTPVKNQIGCAACWAFSVAGCVEGQNARKTGKLEELSVQHLIDCATGQYANDGCKGGLIETGFDFVQDNGISSYAEYPYEGVKTTCRSNDNAIVKTRGYVRILEGHEKALAHALVKYGPISAAIHATNNFRFYGEKVFDDPECRNTLNDLTHAVLIVGYGKEADGKKYWLVKNSYGTTWGLDGYFKMAKDEGNKCGIATYARVPKV